MVRNEQRRVRNYRADAAAAAISGWALTIFVYVFAVDPLFGHAPWSIAMIPLFLVLCSYGWWKAHAPLVRYFITNRGDATLTWIGCDGEILYMFDEVDIWSGHWDAYAIGDGKITGRSHDGWPVVTRTGQDHGTAVSASLLTLREGQ
jgi:hypothetical protein